MPDGEGQYSATFVHQAMDAADTIEGDMGFILAFIDPEGSDGRRCAEWMARLLGCIDPAAI